MVVPLTPQQRKDVRAVVNAYSDFWNNVKFRKGWSEPPFSKRDVQHLLDLAAEIVIRVRSELDKEDPQFKLRMIDGSGREYLWTVCENPDILENPLNFVVGLVHATFQDGVGYVEGLSKDKVDNYINRFMANKPSFHDLKGDKGDEKKERHRLIKLILHAVEELKGEIEDLEHKPSQAGDIDGPLDAMLRDVLELKLKARELLKEEKVAATSAGPSETSLSMPAASESEAPSIEEYEDAEEGAPMAVDSAEEAPTQAPDVEDKVMEEVAAPSEEDENAMKIEEINLNKKEEQETFKEAQTQQEERVEAPSTEEAKTKEEETPVASEQNGKEESPPVHDGKIEIQRVSDDVNKLKGQILDLVHSVEALDSEKLSDDPASGTKVLEGLSKKCIRFTETLMQDLLELDDITNISDENRPLRKKEVNLIQGLMEDLDKIKDRVTQLQTEIKKNQVVEEKPVAVPEASPEEGAEITRQRSIDLWGLTLKDLSEALEPHWRKLKLKVKVDVQEHPYGYALQTYIPGMKLADVKVTIGAHNTLTLKGFRGPSLGELERLRKNTAIKSPVEAILREGAGRYGSFVENLRLPEDADVEGLEATYEAGVLRVIIPRIRNARVRRQPYARGRPVHPFYGGPDAYPGSNFFNDRDFWWH